MRQSMIKRKGQRKNSKKAHIMMCARMRKSIKRSDRKGRFMVPKIPDNATNKQRMDFKVAHIKIEWDSKFGLIKWGVN